MLCLKETEKNRARKSNKNIVIELQKIICASTNLIKFNDIICNFICKLLEKFSSLMYYSLLYCIIYLEM